MTKKICLIYNYAQHYRTNIFTLIDKELDCDFVFGDRMEDVKKMDYTLLSNSMEVKNISLFRKPIYFQKGILKLLKKDYFAFIMLGEVFCLSTWLMLLLSKLFRKKIYLWTHGVYGNEKILRRLINKRFYSLADGILLYGNYARELMIKQGFKPEKLHLIYNSLSYDEQFKLRENLNKTDIFKKHFGNSNKNLIFTGRLNKNKKLELLLYSLQNLNFNDEKFNLILVGDGESKNDLINLANKLNIINNVWFYGSCYNENVLSNLIFNSDLCVSPGNVGLTAIHSMTYGTPVLTHNNFTDQMPEFEAIVEGKTGSFFEEGNEKSLTESISKWFDLKHDSLIITQNCFNVVDKKYNPHLQIETIKKILCLV